MINLMYIVLTAMLALNVSSDVLDGFTQVHEGLTRSNANVSRRNADIFRTLEAFAAQNPDKGSTWLDRAAKVRQATDQMVAMVDSLKLAIVRKADGPQGNPDNIESRDDLESASVVMLAPGSSNGRRLRQSIDNYRNFIVTQIQDPAKAATVKDALSTASVKRQGQLTPQLWEEAKFDQQPVVAAVTILTKIQNDLLYAEGEALNSLLAQVDAGDVRVNKLDALVIPNSRMVMRGGQYSADIVLAAVDTTARPRIFVNGRQLADGHFTTTVGTAGKFTYKGYLEVPHGDGTVTRHDFASEYTVIEPMATV